MSRVLVIGGYGNFGRFISRSLANHKNIDLIIAGRSLVKARALADEIGAEAAQMDIHQNLQASLTIFKPDIVIHTSGPFQGQAYIVAQACIDCGIHYIDLADGREFVSGIDSLNSQAIDANVLIVSGASSVPCLTSALVDYYKQKFVTVDSLSYGITTAQKTTRGLATTAAILGYTGKAFTSLTNGVEQDIYGWQDLKSRKYKNLGRRLFANCNIPDLDLFPKLYPEIKTIRFYAGLELPFIHITLWGLSWLVRWRLIKSLQPFANMMLKLSFLFDCLGTANSGFHMDITGKDQEGKDKTISFELTAKSGDGPYIPCMPAILLAQKLANAQLAQRGAMACVGMISKDEYLAALGDMDITWFETQN